MLRQKYPFFPVSNKTMKLFKHFFSLYLKILKRIGEIRTGEIQNYDCEFSHFLCNETDDFFDDYALSIHYLYIMSTLVNIAYSALPFLASMHFSLSSSRILNPPSFPPQYIRLK